MTLQEIEKKLRKEYYENSKKPDDKESQQKLNELFFNSLIGIIKASNNSKAKTNFSKPFSKPYSKPYSKPSSQPMDVKIPRKRNTYTGSD